MEQINKENVKITSDEENARYNEDMKRVRIAGCLDRLGELKNEVDSIFKRINEISTDIEIIIEELKECQDDEDDQIDEIEEGMLNLDE